MNEIVDFLNQQYDRIEKAAQAATDGPWDAEIHRHRKTDEPVLFEVCPVAELEGNGYGGVRTAADATHIAIHDPDYVLADVASKRRILDEVVDEASCLDMSVDGDRRVGPRDTATEPYLGDVLLRILAAPFSGEPGYREEWQL